MKDLRDRLVNRIQLTSDGHKAYLIAVEEAFGDDVNYGQLVKLYGTPKGAPSQFVPAECIGIRKKTINGAPNRKHISTSYVERQNLSMRMHMRRFSRATNAHSKKFENHCHALALYFMFYNYARINQAVKATPAMAAGIETRVWDMADIVRITDEYQASGSN